MPDKNADLNVRPGESAAAFKARIDETRREMQRESATSAAPAPSPTPAADTAPKNAGAQGSAANAGTASGDLAPGADGQKPPEPGKPEVSEWMKWANAKGYVRKDGTIDAERLATSQRELERELHRRAHEERTKTPPAQPAPALGYPPPPPVQPAVYPPGYYPPAPAPWNPPPAPPRATVEALAKEYDLDPADFDKIARLSSTMVDNAMLRMNREIVAPLRNQVNGLSRDLGRQNELLDLMADPAFKNPQVQFHMDRIMRSNPSIIERDPTPWTTAYHGALNAIAREHLGGPSPEPAAPIAPVEADLPRGGPPKTAGNNGGGGGAPRGSAANLVDPKQFAGLTLDEKRAHLKSLGAL